MKLLVVFFLSLFFTEGGGVCNEGSIYWPLFRCYYVGESSEPVSLDSCQNRICPSKGGTPANIINKEINTIVRDQLNQTEQRKYWLDLTETRIGGYRWNLLSYFQTYYFDWAPGEPSSKYNYMGFQLTERGWEKAPISSKAFCICEKIVDEPIFSSLVDKSRKYLNGNITLEEGDEFILMCSQICKTSCSDSHSLAIRMECDFPVNVIPSYPKAIVNATMQVVGGMDDKKCYCYGELQGQVVHSTLHFTVKYPAEVIFFTLMNYLSISSTFDVKYGKTIQLGCRARGHPKPSVSIHRVGSSDVLETTVIKGVVTSTIKVDWFSGREYICEVRNWFQGNEIVQKRIVMINVLFPPAPCTKKDDNKNLFADLNSTASVQLCLHARSRSDIDSIFLYSTASGRFLSKQRDYNISLIRDSNFTYDLKLTLDMQEDLFGNTRLYYNRKSILVFHVTKRNSSVPVVDQGSHDNTLYLRILDGAIILVCLVLFIVIVFVMRNKWQDKIKKVKRAVAEQIQQSRSDPTEPTVKYKRQEDELDSVPDSVTTDSVPTPVPAPADASETKQVDKPVNVESLLASEDVRIAISDKHPPPKPE